MAPLSLLQTEPLTSGEGGPVRSKPSFTPVARELLEAIHADGDAELSPADAVYTNRDLDMSTVKMVGFDMDYTLAIYKKQPMEQLQYDLTVERLIQRAGYPEEIRQLKYDPTFIVRGLILDKRNGHLIKMDTHGRVGRVFHGRRRLGPDEVREHYKNAKIRLSSTSFASVDTLFSMPEACLYANLVELYESWFRQGKSTAPIALQGAAVARDGAGSATLLGNINTWKLFDDVRTAIDDIHRDGTLKNIIMADLAKYFVVDDGLALTLHKLRSAGKRLFVLTNSYWLYTHAVMSFLLDGRLKEYASWRQYFDLVIVGGKKPKFFTEREPFLEVAAIEGEEHVLGEVDTSALDARFERGRVYQGGNIEAFERMAQAQGEEVLYVGDHIFGDILRSRKESRWRTCLIVEELEDEIKGSITGAAMIGELTALDEDRHGLDDVISQHRALLLHMEQAIENPAQFPKIVDGVMKRLEDAAKKLKKEIDIAKRHMRALDKQAHDIQDALDKHFNVWWGRLLKSNNELSRFGAQVELYACTYTSKVSNFLRYSPVHFFRAPRELMSHDVALVSYVSGRHGKR